MSGGTHLKTNTINVLFRPSILLCCGELQPLPLETAGEDENILAKKYLEVVIHAFITTRNPFIVFKSLHGLSFRVAALTDQLTNCTLMC